ncbi:hypothetical protein NKG05_20835 [Oerskovia sp. M15]
MPLLPRGARRFFGYYIVVTSVLAIFDVAAMSLLALVISPIVTGRTSRFPSSARSRPRPRRGSSWWRAA